MRSKKASKYRRSFYILIALVIAFAVLGCDDFSFYGLIDDAGSGSDPDLDLQISPVSAVMPVGADLVFTSRGGTAPYHYEKISGLGDIDSDTGVYTAPPQPTVAIIRVIDSEGAYVDAQVTVAE